MSQKQKMVAMHKDIKYFNIPISLLPELYRDHKEFASKAIDLAIYRYAETLEGNSFIEKFESALKFLNVVCHIPVEKVIKNIENNENLLSLPEYPSAGVYTGLLWNYQQHDKTEFECLCLGAFISIRSIIGKKPFAKTNKKMIFARMFGYKSPKELPNKRFMNDLQKRYFNRYQIDKILNELQLQWHLKIISNHNRCLYVSFDLSLEELAQKTLSEKNKQKLLKLKEAKKRAIERARTNSTLNNSQQHLK